MRVPLLLLLLLTQLPTVCPLLAKPLHNNINDDDDPPKVKRRAPVIPKEDGSHHFGHPDSLPVNLATKELLSPPPKPKKPLKIFVASLASAFAGGLPGFLAGFVQVMTTMWLVSERSDVRDGLPTKLTHSIRIRIRIRIRLVRFARHSGR